MGGLNLSWRGGLAAALSACVVALAAAPLDSQGAARAPAEAEPGQADPDPPAPLSPEQAAQELREAEEALAGAADPQAGRELTLELRDLALALPYLRPAQRRRARALLSRPPHPNCAACEDYNDAGGTQPLRSGWSAAETERREDTIRGSFRVHWVAAPDGDGGGGNDGNASSAEFAERVAALLERSAQVQHERLGWPQPRSDGARGGDGRVDVYLSDLCDRERPNRPCVFGFAATEDCQPPAFRCAGYLVLDNDFQEFKRPRRALRATIAHEYNHLLQFGLDAAQEPWMHESTATWVEEHVFPDADDWLRSYVRPWAQGPRQSLTDPGAGRGLRVYGSALWNHWLSGRFGPGSILASWERSPRTRPRHWAAGAYHKGIRASGGRGFGPELVRFAAATSEWRTGHGGLPDHGRFPDVRRGKRLLAGGRIQRLRLDNASYALFRVAPKGARRLKLRVWARRGTASGIALVGRRGGPRRGTVVKAVRYLPRGGTATVRLERVRRLRRVTAVVVNADARVRGGPPARVYLRDHQPYRVALRAG